MKNKAIFLLFLALVVTAAWFGFAYHSLSKRIDRGWKHPYVVFCKESLDLEGAIKGPTFDIDRIFKSDICLMDLRTQETIVLASGGKVGRISASPCGKIYYSFGNEFKESVWMIDLLNRTGKRVLSGSDYGQRACPRSNSRRYTFYATNPTCSRDGGRLLFEGNPKGTRAILSADSGGRGIKRLTDQGSMRGSPSWGPKDKRVVYDRRGSDKVFRLWVMKADGSEQSPLFGYQQAYCQRPVWDPKGKWIAFQCNRIGTYGIYALEIDRKMKVKRVVQVAVDGYKNMNPRWSPDGKMIIYQSERPGRINTGQTVMNFDLFVVRFDPDISQKPRKLTKEMFDERDPCWLPDLGRGFIQDDLLSYLKDGISFRDTGKESGI